MIRHLFDDLDAIAQNREPKAVIRTERGEMRRLPIPETGSIEGITLEEFDKYPLLKARLRAFRHCYGQPPEVRRAFEEAMGIAK
jgi:5,5'-dehydrodivanillate O-demethylase